MTRRAFASVFTTRLYVDRRSTALACALAAIVAFVQPHSIAGITDPLTASLAIRSVWLAGPMFFCSTIGIAIALVQGPGRHRYLDAAELGAPLFGRELARAKAVAPAIAASLAALCYWAAQFLSGFAAPPTFFTLALASVLASTMVALNATIRSGGTRALYVALAFATTAISYALAVYADVATKRNDDAAAVASELVFCGVVGFIALRQYGEALARYDALD